MLAIDSAHGSGLTIAPALYTSLSFHPARDHRRGAGWHFAQRSFGRSRKA
jgi:hypothetical protein